MNLWLKKGLGQGLIDSLSSIDDPHHAFRALLVSVILLTLDFVMLGFFFLHLFYTQDTSLMLASLSAVVVLTSVFFYLRKHQNIQTAGHYVNFSLVLFFPIYAHLNQNEQFGLIWLFFTPFIMVAFTGWKLGIRYIAAYLMIVLGLSYLNIGVWEQGEWSQLSFIRLSLGLSLATILAVIIDISHDELNNRIGIERAKEKRYLDELIKLSNTDGLTQLYNRHFFNKTLEDKLTQLKGTSNFLTFFILDIDHFKLYNDHFGHQKGDEALTLVASTIHNYIKSRNEVVFRLGGEEFGGLISNQNPKKVSDWIAKLNTTVENLKIVHADNAPETFLTVSIGVFSSHVKDMDSIRCLYRKADEALYLAKQEGRNKTVVMSLTASDECI